MNLKAESAGTKILAARKRLGQEKGNGHTEAPDDRKKGGQDSRLGGKKEAVTRTIAKMEIKEDPATASALAL